MRGYRELKGKKTHHSYRYRCLAYKGKKNGYPATDDEKR